MKFKELAVGDWFRMMTGATDIIWIKTNEEHARALNYNGNEVIDLADGWVSDTDNEVCFCPRYVWVDGVENAQDDFGKYDNALELVDNYGKIPVGAVYKGRRWVFYRKVNNTTSVLIWSTNPQTMGKEFPYKENQNGTYSICHSFNFFFPEMS